jgi:hypothetical protein
MAKNDSQPMSASAYKKMVDTMILLFNRGPVVGAIVKRIAKAGEVGEVMEYANRIHKLVVKFKPSGGDVEQHSRTPRKAVKRGSRRRAASAGSSEVAEG